MRAVIRQTLLALVLALPAAAAETPAVRLVEPADHATLTGGSAAVIRWDGSVESAGDIEEWEAFLSVDGGRYYSARITPHLDVSIREFRWTVPNVASNDVRILLRFGNEKDERAIELPLALSIRPAPGRDSRPARTSAPGEAARPGDPGVALWAEGDRSGTHVAEVAVSIPGVTACGQREDVERPAIESSGCALQRKTPAVPHSPAEPRRFRPPLLLAADVLVRCRRLNI